jgi:hypothetical protein
MGDPSLRNQDLLGPLKQKARGRLALSDYQGLRTSIFSPPFTATGYPGGADALSTYRSISSIFILVPIDHVGSSIIMFDGVTVGSAACERSVFPPVGRLPATS